MPQTCRKDKIVIDEELLKETCHRCEKWIERTREVLSEEHGVNIGYSTLTAMVRDLGLKEGDKKRSGCSWKGVPARHFTVYYQNWR